MPAVFADEAEAWAKYDEVIRAEWDNLMDPNDDGPYPGDPDEAQDRIRQRPRRRMEPVGTDASRHRNSASEIDTRSAGQSTSASSPLPLQLADGGPITVRPRG